MHQKNVNDFIVLHKSNGSSTYEVMINLNNVSYISPGTNGCYVHFTSGLVNNNASSGLMYINVKESFEELKRKLKSLQL